MMQRELKRSHTCPACGGALKRERDLLRCSEHGAFFVYGPQLLVRAPRSDDSAGRTLMPWESHEQQSLN